MTRITNISDEATYRSRVSEDKMKSKTMRARIGGTALAALCAILVQAPNADATPLDLSVRTFGVLLADQGRDQIVLTRDRNGDGDADDPGEATSFFDASNLSGLASPSANVFTLHQTRDKSVFAGDGDTDTVYRLIDLNGDGDANDAGEAAVWFSEAGNANGFTLPTPNGLSEDSAGGIYVVNAGVASRPADRVYRTIDLNNDGDANDPGESTVWLDLTAVSAVSSAFEIEFVDDVAFIVDQNGGAADTVWRAEDLNEDGDANDPGEVTAFIDDTNAFGVPVGLTIAAGALGLYVTDWFDFTVGHVDSIFRLVDLNGSGTIDDALEAIEVWNESLLPAGFLFDVGFGLAAGPNDDLMLALNASANGGRSMVRLSDLNDDGDYFDDGETSIWGSALELGGFVDRARTVEFIAQAPEPATLTLAAMGMGLLAMVGSARRALPSR
jgi:hypothetical protein